MLIAFNKPYGVLSQFTPEPGSQWRTLADFGFPPNVYSIGRLDADSEGLLLLSDEARWTESLIGASQGHPREYFVQVERIPTDESLKQLETGVKFGDFRSKPARVQRLEVPPDFPARVPPIRMRKSVADCWLSIELTEGKNRQVRRMTAAIGHPTLRLVRVRMGGLKLAELGLVPGKWKPLADDLIAKLLG